MKFKQLALSLFFSLGLFLSVEAQEVRYDLQFEGDLSPLIVNTLYSVSQLHLLQDDPPKSRIGLRRRSEADLPNLIDGLHSLAYYNAKLELDIDYESDPIGVTIAVDPGPVYPIAAFDIRYTADEECLEWITAADLGLRIGRAAYPKTILDAESELLILLAQEGYPLANVTRRRVLADQAEKVIRVEVTVNPGLKVAFGPTRFVGLETVRQPFVYSKLFWQRGQAYDPYLVAKTQLDLESSGLFSAISIQHGEEVIEDNELPFTIYVTEAQHRTIGFGVSYSTYLGPGLLFQWENRNMQGMGRKLGLKTELTAKKQNARAEYIVPNFLDRCQRLKFLLDGEKEQTEAFNETYVSVSGLVERKLTDRHWLSYGLSFKELSSTGSDNNNTFHLAKIPLQFRWNGADHSLSPTSGGTLNIKSTPTAEMVGERFGYVINYLTATAYWPLLGDNLVFAFRATTGSIFGSSRRDIPPPERFYAGSESTLRGYKYLTVSPLDDEDKPIGGRSLMIYSIESRFKLKKNLGWAFFYEIGNVYRKEYPQFDHKQLQSFGCGIRYNTIVGPLRADIAFPINRRPGIDNRSFQFYINIGEAF